MTTDIPTLIAPSTKSTSWLQALGRTKRVQDDEGNWHGFDSETGREL